ncbi:MAG TPA: ATP-binding protein [Ktedonobacteraceae bacterium]|nr:ATP-binding protein [Ktedonobacteraceae bacterium]
MRFTVRSLGGKLIVSAALTLLLCLLCFSAASWYLLKVFYEHEAKSDATMHLALMKRAYQAQTALLTGELFSTASNQTLRMALSHPSTAAANEQIANIFSSTLNPPDRFSGIAFISKSHTLVQPVGSITSANGLSNDILSLVDASLQGGTATLVMPSPGANANSTWDIGFSVPVLRNGKLLGALIGVQLIDYNFALNLLNTSGNFGLNVVLCEAQQIEGNTLHNIALDQRLIEDGICQPNSVNMINAGQHYLTKSIMVRSPDELAVSPGLLLVDIEPLYSLTTHTERALEILALMGVFMITLGVAVYTLIARTFFIQPLRRLQSSIAALVTDTGAVPVQHALPDELSMLARSFNLLSESLNTQENESHFITSRMTDLLAMSDILISTLNLEDLLKEIVSRLGKIMQAKSVSLLLYGREMASPWAVAQWSDMQQSSGHLPAAGPVMPDTVTVHADPAGDITMTATTKLAAIPASGNRAAAASGMNGSGKRRAIRAPRLTPPPEPYGQRRPRIPRPALRDLDMMLARMAMQKQKIAYGEDVNAIYRERRENWARLALEAGYQSVLAVPLFLQDRAIGAVMLYGDSPRQVSGPDTFLLSTAAIQAAMAIQNALLFAEVKDKNAALERVNHLKSQFLATVTHELRTPLHSIISYGSLILEGYVDGDLSEEQQEHIQFMVRRAEDLSRLVDDMLDLSKIEADRLEVKVEPLHLEQSLQDVLSELRQMAGNKGLALTLEMGEELPMALADSHRIRQVLINLVSNALKFTEKGGVTIRCTLLERYDMLRISVSDTGIGISPAALDYIFEAFRQADGSTTRRFGGTGLGLTIARKLIELQGGEVAVESIVGQGSMFSFTLPVAAPARVRAS